MQSQTLQATVESTGKAGRPWMFSAGIDLFFVANIGWPIILLWMIAGSADAMQNCEFWQVYFVTTPHRWITLALVFGDSERFRQRSWLFVGIAAAAVAVVLSVRLTTGTLTCLFVVDYLWNAWHFAAQHHGVFRIYGRLAQPERKSGSTVEKLVMRAFLLYVVFRVATWTWLPYTSFSWFQHVDWGVLVAPLWLLVREAAAFDRRCVGRMAYLISFVTLYTGLLFSVNMNRPLLVLLLTMASALFHAAEYLTVVSWSIQHRHAGTHNPGTVFGRLWPRWGVSLLIFVAILGSAGWMMDNHYMDSWLQANCVIGFLHYAYDGLIWKSPRRKS